MLNFGTNGCRSWILWIVWIFFDEIFENCYLTLTKIKCFCVCKAYMYSIFSLWLSEAHSNIRDPVIFFKFKCIGEKMLQERLIFLQGNFIFSNLTVIVFMKNHFLGCNIFSIFTFFSITRYISWSKVRWGEFSNLVLYWKVSWMSLFWEYIACLTWINSEESVGTAVVLPSEVGYLLPVLFQQGVEFLRPLDPIQNYGRCRGDNRWKW